MAPEKKHLEVKGDTVFSFYLKYLELESMKNSHPYITIDLFDIAKITEFTWKFHKKSATEDRLQIFKENDETFLTYALSKQEKRVPVTLSYESSKRKFPVFYFSDIKDLFYIFSTGIIITLDLSQHRDEIEGFFKSSLTSHFHPSCGVFKNIDNFVKIYYDELTAHAPYYIGRNRLHIKTWFMCRVLSRDWPLPRTEVIIEDGTEDVNEVNHEEKNV